MTVKDLRTLVDNLDEYIHVPGGIERLKKTILHLAVSGQLVPQDPSEGTGEELYQQIQAEKQKLIAEGKLKKQTSLPILTEDEIPFEIPENWKCVRLNDAIDVRDGTHDSPKDSTERDAVPLITSKDFNNGTIHFENTKMISPKDHEEISKRSLVEKFDILFSMIGGNIGNQAMVLSDVSFSVKNVALFKYYSQELTLPKFIKLYMEHTAFELQEKASGGAQPFVSLGVLRSLSIGLPPVKEQKRIVSKIEEIRELVYTLENRYEAEQAERKKLVVSSLAHLARGNDKLALTYMAEIIKTKVDTKELRKTILHLAVSGKLVPQDPSEGTGEGLYKQIQSEKAKLLVEGKLKKQKPLPEITEEEIPFEIPKTWKWTRLGEVGATTTGKTPPTKKYSLTEGSIPFIGPGDITKSNIIKNEVPKKISEEAVGYSEKAVADDLLMVCIGGSIGKAALVDYVMCFNQQINKITPIALDSKYLFDVLTSGYFNHLVINSAAGGATPIINQTRWAKLPVPLPPQSEQSRIVQKTTQLLDLVAKLEKHLEK